MKAGEADSIYVPPLPSDFDWKRMPSYDETRIIPLDDCDDTLVAIQCQSSEVICHYRSNNMQPYTGEEMLLRKAVLGRLLKAHSALKYRLSGATFHVGYAYRHPEIQERYFLKKKAELASAHPDLGEEALLRTTNLYIASNDVAGHTAGAAVDLTILQNGSALDMGWPFGDTSSFEGMMVFSSLISEKAMENRLLLRSVMIEQGFAPYNGEWWHFSFGDREWAAFYGMPGAIYGPVLYEWK